VGNLGNILLVITRLVKDMYPYSSGTCLILCIWNLLTYGMAISMHNFLCRREESKNACAVGKTGNFGLKHEVLGEYFSRPGSTKPLTILQYSSSQSSQYRSAYWRIVFL
jgi:hypothetical protein